MMFEEIVYENLVKIIWFTCFLICLKLIKKSIFSWLDIKKIHVWCRTWWFDKQPWIYVDVSFEEIRPKIQRIKLKNKQWEICCQYSRSWYASSLLVYWFKGMSLEFIFMPHVFVGLLGSCNFTAYQHLLMKRSFFQAAVASILLYGCTTWTLTKRLEKKLDSNYTRILRATLNKSWRQHPTRHQLYGQLPSITKTIQVRRTRHAGHCWKSRDELISDILQWSPIYGWANAGQPARTYIQQLYEDTECSPEDLPGVINDREKWRERVRDIRATSTTWWW